MARLRRILTDGTDRDANFAIQLVFKAAGLFDNRPFEAKVEDDALRSGVVYLPAKSPEWKRLLDT